MNKIIKKTKSGYYKIVDRPTAKDLQLYYQDLYFQKLKSTYQKRYSLEEKKYLNNKFKQKKYILENEIRFNMKGKKFLDIGCGEGFALEYFEKQGMDVKGIDYSSEGLKKHNKQYINSLIVGDIDKILNRMINKKNKYDLILLDNVLEHVLKPGNLLEKVNYLLAPKGIVMIEVPNDFSTLQKKLVDESHVDKPYWITIPDHLNYFNMKSLVDFCDEKGLKEKYTLTDYPIDLNLLFSETNYIKNIECGTNCHSRRLTIENYLCELSIEHTVNIQKELASMGLGRNILSFMGKKEQ